MKYRRQHFIPSSYLQAWCDPQTPTGHTPYVWRFAKDGTEVKNKAPKRVFHEKDMYTVIAGDGERDLHLEANLSRVENEFAKLRNRKLAERKSLTPRERLLLCMFVAAMHSRTKAYRENQSAQWQNVLEFMERFESAFEKASPKEREHMAAALGGGPPVDEDRTMSREDVRERVEQPIQSMLSVNVTTLAPMLFKTPFHILETPDGTDFITSDDPCVWFDPAVYLNPVPPGAGGLVSPTLQITLPISPNQMLVFGNGLPAIGVYLPIKDQELVDNLNKRTRYSCHEHFISNSKEIRASWF